MEDSKSAYMLLFRGNDWAKGLSPEQMQQVMAQWMAWFEGLMASGKAKSGHPLEASGKIVTSRNGRNVISDGPFAESKEAIGGYFFLDVAGLDEALEIAQQCPGLPYGIGVEVRPVADMCPVAKQYQQELAHASA